MQRGLTTLQGPQTTQYSGQRKIVTATALQWESKREQELGWKTIERGCGIVFANHMCLFMIRGS